MSTNEKMLGKESNKKKAHRRYSMLLLALLFIGFATYGTYAYFTSSTSTTKGHLTLNGMEKVTLGGDTASSQSGDGAIGSGDYQYDPTSSTLEEVTEDNDTKFGEFNWYYVGNTGAVTTQTVSLADSLTLPQFNTNVSSTDNETFNGVNSGDVFRKTVRLKVSSTENKAVGSIKISWGEGTISGEELPNGVSATMYTKIGNVSDGVAPSFDTNGFATTALTANSAVSKAYDEIKGGQYLDIELLVHVGEGVSQPENLVLAKIARQIKVTITQDAGIKSRTELVSSTTTAQN